MDSVFTEEAYCDLHLHSTCSDGTDSPRDVVGRAAQKGLRAVALTDHDTVKGLADFHEAGREYNVETIDGVEMTAGINGREIHILGYFIDAANAPLLDCLMDQENHRLTRVQRMIVKLQAQGITIHDEDMEGHAARGTLGRPHVAMVLVEKGYASSIDDAFYRFLGRSGSAFVEKPMVPAREAIRLIREAQGVAVLAHPGIAHVDSSIRNLVDDGLQGLEVWHISHSERHHIHYLKICADLGLAPTGGSDCHGSMKGQELMGKVRVSYDRLESLKKLTRTDSGSAATPDRDF